jgi:hypothetical protein
VNMAIGQTDCSGQLDAFDKAQHIHPNFNSQTNQFPEIWGKRFMRFPKYFYSFQALQNFLPVSNLLFCHAFPFYANAQIQLSSNRLTSQIAICSLSTAGSVCFKVWKINNFCRENYKQYKILEIIFSKLGNGIKNVWVVIWKIGKNEWKVPNEDDQSESHINAPQCNAPQPK